MSQEPSVFTKIINREIPASIRFEDDEFIVIDDIHPKAPIHMLIIPKQTYRTLEEADIHDEHFHAKILLLARKMARDLGISDNYKLVMNVGLDIQEVHHIHLHLLGGWEKTKVPKDI
jgi:histidine triad (HIT) family protein